MAMRRTQPTQQDALLRILGEETDEPVAVPYSVGGGAPSGRVGSLGVQTAGKPGGEVSQLPGSGGAIADTTLGTGASLAPVIAKAAGQKALTGSVGGLGAGAAMGIGAAGEIGGALLKRKEQLPTYGGEFGDITDEYGRRFESNGGGALSNAATWAGRGAQIGSVIPGVGTAIGAGVGALGGAIKGWATKNADSAYSDFSKEDAGNALSRAYEQYLGRPASPEEVQTRLTGQGLKPGDRWVGEKNLFAQLGDIKNSDEAQTFAAGGATPASAAGAAGGGVSGALADLLGGNTGAAGGIDQTLGSEAGADAAPVDASGWDTDGYSAPKVTAQSFGNAPPGFDQTKWADPNHQTPKYVVGRLIVESGGDKDAFAAKLAQAYPGATFNGKDKISIPGVGNNIDVFRGASAGINAPQWLPEENQGGGGGEASGAHAAGGGGSAIPQVDQLGSGSLEAIMAALSQIAQGPNDPKTLQASLLRQLTNAGA